MTKPRQSLSADQQRTFDNLLLDGLNRQDTQMMHLAFENGANGRMLDVVLDAGPEKYSLDMIKFALTHGANPNVLLFTGIRRKKFSWLGGRPDVPPRTDTVREKLEKAAASVAAAKSNVIDFNEAADIRQTPEAVPEPPRTVQKPPSWKKYADD